MMKQHVNHFFYHKVAKPLISLSKLGRASIMGRSDSGLNFDHMYRNKPKGITVFGRFVDKVLLNLPSVKATRHRKDIIIKILENEIKNNVLFGKKTKILDIASGPARYLTELITNANQDKLEVICLDRDRRAINFGKVLAGKGPVRYSKVNIFKLDRLKRFSNKILWKPDIIISSGLFEYLKDDEVKKILADVYSNIENGGLFIFATQKNNPSKELMSEICVTQSGSPWELTYREPDILRKWIIDAGFKAVIISVDQWGMYEFCTGRKY
jgi:hypothetical protein